MLCLLLVGRRKKRKGKKKKERKKREAARGFFPRAGAGHALLECQAGFWWLLYAIKG
jgi:hypothetical protein